MNRGAKEVQKGKLTASDVEQYRRLVGLQKQMIQLAEQYERTKRECDDLREQMRRRPAIVLPMKRTAVRPSAKKPVSSSSKMAMGKLALKLVISGSIAEAAQKIVKAVGR